MIIFNKGLIRQAALYQRRKGMSGTAHPVCRQHRQRHRTVGAKIRPEDVDGRRTEREERQAGKRTTSPQPRKLPPSIPPITFTARTSNWVSNCFSPAIEDSFGGMQATGSNVQTAEMVQELSCGSGHSSDKIGNPATPGDCNRRTAELFYDR